MKNPPPPPPQQTSTRPPTQQQSPSSSVSSIKIHTLKTGRILVTTVTAGTNQDFALKKAEEMWLEKGEEEHGPPC
ncbi:hypothetical protein Tco_0793712 [Tanacetum coccineum]